ncbi:MAG: hypothetical protein N2572_04290 [Syntrophales bacterium]|nr:hypothetical protein [Syntrophales bacterium]
MTRLIKRLMCYLLAMVAILILCQACGKKGDPRPVKNECSYSVVGR